MRFLYSAFVTLPLWLRNSCVNHLPPVLLSSSSTFDVGGKKFTIFEDDARKFPSSLINQLIEATPREEGVLQDVVIDRSGDLFKYVYTYLVSGHLPKDDKGCITLDEQTLHELQAEADFYGLQALADDCQVKSKPPLHLAAYLSMVKFIDEHIKEKGRGEIVFQHKSRLARVLKGMYSLFCLTGRLYRDISIESLIRSNTKHKINLEDVLGSHTEICASKLNTEVLNKVAKQIYYLKHLAPHIQLSLRAHKLVVHRAGCKQDLQSILPSTKIKGRIGTLVVILNSTYTGGELEVTHGGRTEVVTGPYSWVAMYGDCLHKINPVTSGTRVSLIYDIYGAPPAKLTPSEKSNKYRVDAVWTSYSHDRGLENSKQVTEKRKTEFVTALDKEFQKFDTLILSLQHLYPEGQTNPAILVGGDRNLYDILAEKNVYDVEVVAATVFRSTSLHRDDLRHNFVHCDYYSPEIVQRALNYERDEDASSSCVTQNTKLNKSSKLIMATPIPWNGRLWFMEEMDDGLRDEILFMVSGLQVRKKVH